MRKYLLPENGNFYKANLHCHTTVSDGRKTPAEIKDIYVRGGYSVVAFTDHNVMIPHPELRDENFLPMIGYEINVNEPGYPQKDRKTCHLCFVSLKDGNPKQVIYTQSCLKKATLENSVYVNREGVEDYTRTYDADCINDIIRIGRENDFFVTYNHPSWSLENYSDYMNYHGMNAMEIVNWGCLAVGYNDYNDRVYDDMLRGGEMIYCIATDDNHNKYAEDDPHWDSCGGWTMIKADKLEYDDIADALVKGNFYASMGPEIKALWYEDGKVHIETSDAAAINCIYGVRTAHRAVATDAPLTVAEFPVSPEQKWFRLDVVDAHGNHANTSAYCIADLAAE